MSSKGGNGPILFGALKDLNSFWDRTASVWRDSARDKFEKDYLQDLVEKVRAASTVIDQIEQLLRQVRNECS